MYVMVWLMAMATALSPQPLMTMSAQALEAQTATVEAATRPLMTLGWVDEEDAPIF